MAKTKGSRKRRDSYKHPILEHIFKTKTAGLKELPDEIIFTYEDIRQAMTALGVERLSQASISNFTLDTLRQSSSHEQRVPPFIWDSGYDLDRVVNKKPRQGINGRLVRKELKPKNPWVVWPEISEEDVITIPNIVPIEVLPYLGKDEGALLSVMDYCDVLSLALHQTTGTIKRVQHPKKWQPGEVDGLYYSDYQDNPVLYPVEAKALSTKDDVNVAQVQSAYKTTLQKISGIEIIPLAVQMTLDGMYIAVFEATDTEPNELVITRYLKVRLTPVIATWQPKPRKPRKKKGLENQPPLL